MSRVSGTGRRRRGVDVGDAVRVVGPRYVPRATPVARSGDTAELPLGRVGRPWRVLAIAGPVLAGVLALGVGAGSVVGWTALQQSMSSAPSAPSAPAARPGPVVGAPIAPVDPAPVRDDQAVLVSAAPGPGEAGPAPSTTAPPATTSSTAAPSTTAATGRPVRQRPHPADARPVGSSAVTPTTSTPAQPSAEPTSPSGPDAASTTPLPTVATGSPTPGAG